MEINKDTTMGAFITRTSFHKLTKHGYGLLDCGRDFKNGARRSRLRGKGNGYSTLQPAPAKLTSSMESGHQAPPLPSTTTTRYPCASNQRESWVFLVSHQQRRTPITMRDPGLRVATSAARGSRQRQTRTSASMPACCTIARYRFMRNTGATGGRSTGKG